MAKSDDDYEVGYGKPPKAHQFKKGQSGNPKGRPKASKSVGLMMEEIFFRKIKITENGTHREVTMVEAILRQLVNGAVKGEQRSIDKVLKLLPYIEETRAAAAVDAAQAASDPEADHAVLEALAGMFGTDPSEMFASFQKGEDDV